jgi:sulfite reductase (NADPH) flavoprotein alpha-component
LLLCSIPGQWGRSRGASACGAYVYVCGDAKRMAKDVEGAWIEIVAAHGARTTDEAIAFVANLKKSGRYQQDVY